MKIIIAGAGKVGTLLVKQLSAEGYDLIVIDTDPEALDFCVENYDVMGVYGNCAVKSVLLEADIKSADVLIAVTQTDELNLLCCMMAHTLHPTVSTIARIRNPEYIEQVYEMRDTYALSMIVNPERQAAAEIERLLKYPGFLKIDTFAKGRAEIIELSIDADSKLCNISLNSISHVVHCKVLVCIVLRDGQVMMPNGDFILRENDRIFVSAPANDMTTLLVNLGIPVRKTKKALICGGSRTGFYLAEYMHKNGIAVKIIESNRKRCELLAELLPYADIICGDASSLALLESEDLAEYDTVVALTGMDEINMIIAMYGKTHSLQQVITKLDRVEDQQVLTSLNLGSIISPKALCSNHIVRYVRAMKNKTGAAAAVHFIAYNKAEAMEFRVNAETPHCGKKLRDIKLRKNLLIACISHGRRMMIPDGDSMYVPGDTIIVVTNTKNEIERIQDIFA